MKKLFKVMHIFSEVHSDLSIGIPLKTASRSNLEVHCSGIFTNKEDDKIILESFKAIPQVSLENESALIYHLTDLVFSVYRKAYFLKQGELDES